MKGKKWLIIALAVVVVLAIGGTIVYFAAVKPKINQPAKTPDIAQVAKDAQAIVDGNTSNIQQVSNNILQLGEPMYDDANMMYVLAKYYAEQGDKPAAKYYLDRIDYTDSQIDQQKIQDLTSQIEALPDPVIEEGSVSL
jgi:hypothetical protein